jgi:tRNA pseudouridine55 synthase
MIPGGAVECTRREMMYEEDRLKHAGLIVVNKPSGLTSRAVVDRVLRLVRPAKAGHAGTLDPLATGVLVVAVGSATRLIEYAQRMRKCYTGTFLMGRESPTEDIEGEVRLLENPPEPSLAEIDQAAAKLVGEIQQRPPAFSALKVAGQRAYDLARAGKTVELEARPVTIYSLSVARYDYPELVLDIECSGGTYVRSLGRDLALSLGTAAVMSGLVRTAIGAFTLDTAVTLDQLTRDNVGEHLLPPGRAVEGLPRVDLTAAEVERMGRGQFIADRARLAAEMGEFAGFDPHGRLAAILKRRPDGTLGPLRNFSAAE